jgi:hypothetical protein
MSISSYPDRLDKAREEAVNLVITAIQAAPEAVPKGLSGGQFAEFLITCAKKVLEYIDHSSVNLDAAD